MTPEYKIIYSGVFKNSHQNIIKLNKIFILFIISCILPIHLQNNLKFNGVAPQLINQELTSEGLTNLDNNEE